MAEVAHTCCGSRGLGGTFLKFWVLLVMLHRSRASESHGVEAI